MTKEEKINTLKAIIQECEEYQWQRKETLFEIIKDLEQEPKKGKWIDCKCDKCGYEIQPWNTTRFCPNCGNYKGDDEA